MESLLGAAFDPTQDAGARVLHALELLAAHGQRVGTVPARIVGADEGEALLPAEELIGLEADTPPKPKSHTDLPV